MEFGNFTVLIGKNDAGKSSIMNAILAFLEPSKTKVDENDFHKKNYNNEITISMIFAFNKKFINKIKNIIKNIDKLISCSDNECLICISKNYKYDSQSSKITNTLYFCDKEGEPIKKKEYKLQNTQFNKLREELLPIPLYIPSFIKPDDAIGLKKGAILSELITPLIEEQHIKQGNETKRLKDLIKEETEKSTKQIAEDIKQYLTKAWPDIEDIEIRVTNTSLTKSLEIEVVLKDKYIDEIPLSKRGSGIQREFIIELLRVYRDRKISKGYLFMIEEPEIFLHAGAQKKFFSILKGLSSDGQVIITTHSHIFIDKADLRYTYLFKKEKGETRLAYEPNQTSDFYAKVTQILNELGASASDFLLADGVIIVEGIIDKVVLEKFARKIYEEWDAYNIVFLPFGGKPNIRKIKDYVEDLFKINRNIAIILDSDISRKIKGKIFHYNRVKNCIELLNEKDKNFVKELEKRGIEINFYKKDGICVKELENIYDVEIMNKYFSRKISKTPCSEKCKGPFVKDSPNIYNIEILEQVEKKLMKDCKCSKGIVESIIDKNDFNREVAEMMIKENKIPHDVKIMFDNILSKFGIK